MAQFDGVPALFAEALTKRGYEQLTPVQEAVLAPEYAGADLLVSAQTGSGKTAAFGLTMASDLLPDSERFGRAGLPLALIVAPTRELALQIRRELEWLYQPTGAVFASCVGGMDMRTERRALERGAHIVVGTPGRLRDHIQRNSLNPSSLKTVVLDEADEMLDLGFREELEFILDATPSERRTLLFSATVPRQIANLAKKYQNNAARISTKEEKKQHVDIDYRALSIAKDERENAIVNVLRFYEAQSALVFCATRATVNHMTSRFNNRGFSVVALSGELSQNERTHALQAMRDGRARVCICTDVAARGIDLPNLELVIHADLPTNKDTLLHRSGRTGRAGRKGTAVLMVPPSARKKAERLLHSASINAQWAKPPSVADVLASDDNRILTELSSAEQATEDESAFGQKLLDEHGAEKLAAAYVRLHRAGKSAPEELLEASPYDQRSDRRSERGNDRASERPSRAPRDDFGDSVWFSLSVGRKHQAEPRWLLPLLCKAGDLQKSNVGSIKMQPEETFVQISAEKADSFLAAVGPSRKLEGTISVTRLDEMPAVLADRDQPSGKPKRKFSGKKSGGKKFSNKRFDKKPGSKPRRAKPAGGASGTGNTGNTGGTEAGHQTRRRPRSSSD